MSGPLPEIPDPRKDQRAILLGTLELPVEATGRRTIQELQNDLKPNGVPYRPPGWAFPSWITAPQTQVPGGFFLDNLFATTLRANPVHLGFGLEFDAPEPQLPLGSTWIFDITVLRPGLRSIGVVVEVPSVTTGAGLRASIQQQLEQLGFCPAQALVLLWLPTRGAWEERQLSVVGEDEAINVPFLDPHHPKSALKELLVCWLPKAPERQAKGGQGKGKGKGALARQAARVSAAAPAPTEELLEQLGDLQEQQSHHSQQYALVRHEVDEHYSYSTAPLFLLLPFKENAARSGKRARDGLASQLRELLARHRCSWFSGEEPSVAVLKRSLAASGDAATASASAAAARGALGAGTAAGGAAAAAAAAATATATAPSPRGQAPGGGGALAWLVPGLLSYYSARSTPLYGYQLHPPVLRHPAQAALELDMDERSRKEANRWRLLERQRLLLRLPLYDVVSELCLAARWAVNYDASCPRPVCAIRAELICPDPSLPRLGTARFQIYTWPFATIDHGSLLSDPGTTASPGNTLAGAKTVELWADQDVLRESLDYGWYSADDGYSDSSDASDSGDSSDSSGYGRGFVQPRTLGSLVEAARAADGAGDAGQAEAVGAAAGAAATAAVGSVAGAALDGGGGGGGGGGELAQRLTEALRLREVARATSRVALPLRMTLRLLGAGSPELAEEYRAYEGSHEAWSKAEKSIKGLLDVLVTGPCEPAAQPEGLTVRLRPHQQQALTRLLAAEAAPLGFSSMLWKSFESAGRTWWVSLPLNKLSMQAPPATVSGGFLASEMGLGKTIQILALVLANPAPEAAPGCGTRPGERLPTEDDEQQQQPRQQPAGRGRGRGKGRGGKAATSASGKKRKARGGGREDEEEEGQEEEGGGGGGTVDAEAAATPLRPAKRSRGRGGGAAGAKEEEEEGGMADAGQAETPPKAAKRGRGRGHGRGRDSSGGGAGGDRGSTAHAGAAAEPPPTATKRGRGRGRGRGGRGQAGPSAAGAAAAAAPEAAPSAPSSSAQAAAAVQEQQEQAQGNGAEGDEAAPPGPASSLQAGLLYSRATLVVCATSLVGQWIDEARDKTGGALRILSYHGTRRAAAGAAALASQYDVVVTTYSTLVADRNAASASRRSTPPLEEIHWWRVVFDEGHCVKSPGSASCRAAAALSAGRRWVVTGTPVGTAVTDLTGQARALHLWPLTVGHWFGDHVRLPFSAAFLQRPRLKHSALPFVHLMRHVVVRHTAAQQLDGAAVLELPPKTVHNVPVMLNAEEKGAYLEAYGKAREAWLRLAAAGHGAVSKHVLAAMGLLQPLRRICSGGRLRVKDLQVRQINLASTAELATEAAAAAAAGALASGLPLAAVEAPEEAECCVCLDVLEAPTVTPCMHWFCKECILSCVLSKGSCPLCRHPLASKDLRAGIVRQQPAEQDDDDANRAAYGAAVAAAEAAAEAAGGGADPVLVCDSKLKVLLKELEAMRAADLTSKALVFSQHNSTLEWLKQALPAAGFDYRFISGTQSVKQRTSAIAAFQHDPPTTVFLLSVRSGAVGINLTAASHVFLLEPCLNPALEEQAIGRAWRLGQQREVVVKRLYVQGSVEERIVALAEARRSGAHIPGTSRWGDVAAGLSSTAAASQQQQQQQQQLAGHITTDTQKLRVAELEGLFAQPTLPPAQPLPTAAQAAAAVAAAAGEGGAAAAAAAASGSAGSSSSPALGASDLQLERRLAEAGLLDGSSRAAAWEGLLPERRQAAGRARSARARAAQAAPAAHDSEEGRPPPRRAAAARAQALVSGWVNRQQSCGGGGGGGVDSSGSDDEDSSSSSSSDSENH